MQVVGGAEGIVGGMNTRVFAGGLLALVTALAAAPAAQWPLFEGRTRRACGMDPWI